MAKNDPIVKIHPWRMCPTGEHWVRTHPLHVPPSQKNPEGSVTTRLNHCARNPSGKDQMYPDEIHEIAGQHFKNAKNKPCPLPLAYKNGSKYDELIAGWVQYWTEVLKPDEPLDPNLVKVLLASESGFDPTTINKTKDDTAFGLMQVTNTSRITLANEKGEVKNHYITANEEEIMDPNIWHPFLNTWEFIKSAKSNSAAV
jgi:hypothetical protein